jgi:hypothetical protein
MERLQEESFSSILITTLLKQLCPHCTAVHLTQYSVHNGLLINSDMDMVGENVDVNPTTMAMSLSIMILMWTSSFSFSFSF